MANIAVVRQQQRAVFAPATTVRNNLCGGARKRIGSGIGSTGPRSAEACPRDSAMCTRLALRELGAGRSDLLSVVRSLSEVERSRDDLAKVRL